MTTQEAIDMLDQLSAQVNHARNSLASGQFVEYPDLNLNDEQFYQMAQIGDFTVYWPRQLFRGCGLKDRAVTHHETGENFTASTGESSGKPVNVL